MLHGGDENRGGGSVIPPLDMALEMARSVSRPVHRCGSVSSRAQVESGMLDDLRKEAVLAWFVTVASFLAISQGFGMILHGSDGLLLISKFDFLGSLHFTPFSCVCVLYTYAHMLS